MKDTAAALLFLYFSASSKFKAYTDLSKCLNKYHWQPLERCDFVNGTVFFYNFDSFIIKIFFIMYTSSFLEF